MHSGNLKITKEEWNICINFLSVSIVELYSLGFIIQGHYAYTYNTREVMHLMVECTSFQKYCRTELISVLAQGNGDNLYTKYFCF